MATNKPITEMSHDEWLDERRKGIGGSDAGALLGLSSYNTPLDVYLDKIGQADPIEDNDAMYWGRVLEDIVAAEYEKRSGNKVRRNNKILQHKDHPFIMANLDREIIGKNGILECKTAGRATEDWGPDGSDIVPTHYIAQVMHYMAVTGADFADLAVLIGGRDFRIYHIPRDEEIIKMVIDREIVFWTENVEARVAPDPVNINDINNLWPHDNGTLTAANAGDELDIQAAKEIKFQMKELKARETELTNKIKESMGEISGLTDRSGKILVTWKERKSMRLDTKRLKVEQPEVYDHYVAESSSRTFLIK